MVAGLADQSLLPNPDPIPSTVLQERK